MKRFQKDIREGQFITVTLPEQDPLNEANAPVLRPAEVVIFHQHDDRRALTNALELLETLYAHNVTSPHVLRLILTATGHTRIVNAQQNENTPAATGAFIADCGQDTRKVVNAALQHTTTQSRSPKWGQL